MSKIKFEVLRCPDCGAKALSMDDTRITGSNCKQWEAVETFFVERSKLTSHLTAVESDRATDEQICKECGLSREDIAG